jgi:hypothetical protein
MALPVDGYLEDNARTEGTMKTAMEDILEAVKMIPGVGITVQDLTIASGNVTPAAEGVSLVLSLGGESGADDTLDTITSTNIEDGAFVVLMRNTQNITINNQLAGGTDSIALQSGGANNFTLDQDDKYLVLRYDSGDTRYYEVWRSWGSQSASQDAEFRTHYRFGDVVDNINVGTASANVPQNSDIYGPQTIWVPADAMYAASTNGCQTPIDQVELTAGQPERRVFWFDGATVNEYAQFSIGLPKSWDEGTLTARFFFTSTSVSAANTCIWGLQAVALDHNDPLQTAFGTAQTVSTTLPGAANDMMVSGWTSAITVASPVSIEEGDLTYFAVYRDQGTDTEPLDCGLIGLQLRYTTDAHNDT